MVFYRVAVEGKVIRGLLYESRESAKKTVKRLIEKHGYPSAKVTTRRPA